MLIAFRRCLTILNCDDSLMSFFIFGGCDPDLDVAVEAVEKCK